MSRVILCKVGDKPRVIWLDADPGGGHATALQGTLSGPVACVPLHDGIQLCVALPHAACPCRSLSPPELYERLAGVPTGQRST